MLPLKQSTSGHEDIEESAHAIVPQNGDKAMISPKLKKYAVRSHRRSDVGTDSKRLRIPSIAQGYSSSDHSSLSRTQLQQNRHDSTDIPVFNPSPPHSYTSNRAKRRRHVPPPKHSTHQPQHVSRSNTLPSIHDVYSASSPVPRMPLKFHRKRVSQISERRMKHKNNKNGRKKRKVAPNKLAKSKTVKSEQRAHRRQNTDIIKTKQRAHRSHNTENIKIQKRAQSRHNTKKIKTQRRHNIENINAEELIKSDSELFGGPKPYFVVRTPVTAGPFSPYPTARNLSKSSDSEYQFPDTEPMQTPESPLTVSGYSGMRNAHHDGYENRLSQRETDRKRRRPQTSRKSPQTRNHRNDRTHAHDAERRSRPRTAKYSSHNLRKRNSEHITSRVKAKHHSEHKLKHRNKAYKKHYKSNTMTITQHTAEQYAYNYAAYAEQEKERRNRKKTKKKVKNRKKRKTEPEVTHPVVTHPLHMYPPYHIVSEDEELSRISSRNDGILFQ